jgi:hypothetical protein
VAAKSFTPSLQPDKAVTALWAVMDGSSPSGGAPTVKWLNPSTFAISQSSPSRQSSTGYDQAELPLSRR